MKLNKNVKKHTKQSLKGNRICLVCAVMMIFILTASIIFFEKMVTDISNTPPYIPQNNNNSVAIFSTVPNLSFKSFYITSVTIIIYAVIIKPLWAGFKKITVGCVMKSYGYFFHILYFFRNYKLYCKILFLNLYLFIRTAIIGLIFTLPGIAVIIFDVFYSKSELFLFIKINQYSVTFISFMGVILFLLGWLLKSIYISKFSLAIYLLIKSPKLSIFKCVKYSCIYTKGQISNLVSFKLSFIPLMLLGMLIIPIFYILPYYISCYSAYAMYLIEKGTHVDNQNEEV